MSTCTAHRTDGEPCEAPAIRGGAVCAAHGGRAPQVANAAERRRAIAKVSAELERIGIVDVDPLEALAFEVSRSATFLAFLGGLVGELADDRGNDGPEAGGALYGPNHLGDGAPHVLVKMWNEERDRLARFAKMAADAGVAERRVRMAESQGQAIAALITRVLEDLGLTLEQRQAAPAIVRRRLLELAAGSVA